MNIWVLDKHPVKAAMMLDDQRVTKMCYECFQMICTNVQMIKGPIHTMAKMTHENHPCTVWVRQGADNYMWVYEHMLALDAERIRRLGPRPAGAAIGASKVLKIEQYAKLFPSGSTPFVNAAANKELGLDFRHVPDVHDAYWQYLNARWQMQQRDVEAGKPHARLPMSTVSGYLAKRK